tara:strand:+ start:374 stop:562 length:189 start_codon:yes stop_codon:yes gene_type:complete
MVGVMVFNMFCNFYVIFKIGFRGIYMIIVKYKRIICDKYEKKVKPKLEKFYDSNKERALKLS